MIEKLPDITNEMWENVNPENRKMVDEFLSQSKQLSPQTLKQYESGLKIYFWWISENCDNKAFHEIKGRQYLFYQNYLQDRGLSSAAIKLKRSVVSSFNGYIELFYSEEFPMFRNYVNKKVAAPPPAFVNKKEPLTLNEYKHLCEELEKKELWQQLAYLKFSFSSGCRRAEARQLLKSDTEVQPTIKDIEIKDENGEKKIVQSKSYMTSPIRCKGRGKIGKVRNLQFDQNTMDVIKKWLKARGEDDCPYVFITRHGKQIKQVAVETFNFWCDTIFEEIVGRRVHPHLFRESRATTLVVEQGKDKEIAQKLLGHASSTTTDLYIIKNDADASDEAFV